MASRAARQVLDLYPRIFFACHVRHIRDPRTRRLLTSHQASILDHLDPARPAGLAELAQHMGVTASTMSLSIDRLERLGFIVRRRDPGDGRRIRLLLTPAGVRIKQTDRVLDPARVRAMLAHLSRLERRRALEGLALLASGAQALMQQAGSGWTHRRTAKNDSAYQGVSL